MGDDSYMSLHCRQWIMVWWAESPTKIATANGINNIYIVLDSYMSLHCRQWIMVGGISHKNRYSEWN